VFTDEAVFEDASPMMLGHVLANWDTFKQAVEAELKPKVDPKAKKKGRKKK